jgi:hypothetical protein
MTGAIALGVYRILGFEQDLIGVVNQERAKGVIAVVTGTPGNDNRPPQMHKVLCVLITGHCCSPSTVAPP